MHRLEIQSRKLGLAAIGALVFSVLAASAALMGLTSPLEPRAAHATQSALSRARRLLDDGKIAEARKIFADELKRDSNSVEALRGLALCARDDGDDETALRHLQKLTSLAPKDRAAWRLLALAASRLGRNMEALAAAQTTLSLSPEGDSVMTHLMTRLLSSKESLANGALEDPFGDIGPTGIIRSKMPADPLDRMPKPKTPNPSQALPRPGRSE